MMTTIAIVQLTSSANVATNLQMATALMTQARERGAELIVLPENFAYMGLGETDKLQIAETHRQGPIQDAIAQWAKRMGCWVIAGTIPLKTAGQKVRSSCLVYDEKGREVARYDKIHLFDVRISQQEAHQESMTIERGDQLAVLQTPAGVIGLTICYDLRFPELYQKLAQQGAQIFTVPSAFTAITGQAHWEILLRARAVENLCYVLAPNQSGQHENGRQTYGHSMVVEPW
jgi:nitrilase